MATKKTQARKKKGIPVAGVAAGVAAAAAAAGAAYYFYGSKRAKSHRRKAAAWASAMKREVVKQAKTVQKIDDKVVRGIVDRVAGTYRAARSVDPAELKAAADELKKNWKRLRSELRSTGTKPKKAAKKSSKKRAKKRA